MEERRALQEYVENAAEQLVDDQTESSLLIFRASLEQLVGSVSFAPLTAQVSDEIESEGLNAGWANNVLLDALNELRRGKLVPRQEVYDTIDTERAWQEDRWGSVNDSKHDLGKWISLAIEELTEAVRAPNERVAVKEIVQAAAVLVACLEHKLDAAR